MREDVEFLHPGPLLQQQLTAVDVKQHARDAAHPPKLKIAPIVGGWSEPQLKSYLIFFLLYVCFTTRMVRFKNVS